MSIASWRSSQAVQDVLALPRGRGITSFWPAIISSIERYAQLQDGDIGGRRRGLLQIENAVGLWLHNQQSSRNLFSQSLAASKRDAIRQLGMANQAEWSEIEGRTGGAVASASASASVPRSTASAPITIGGGGVSQWSHAASISPPEVPGVFDKYGVWPSEESNLRGVSINETDLEVLHRAMDIHLHYTRNRHADDISSQGLQPGRGRGIGLPDGGRDNLNYYTLSGSSSRTTLRVQAEAGPRQVVVFSRRGSLDMYRDHNYRSGARAVPGGTVPLGPSTNLNNGPVSIVLPLDTTSAGHLSSFFARISNTAPPSNVQAAAILDHYLRNFHSVI